MIGLLSFNAFALDVNKPIIIEWGYTPPVAPAVSGFNLYQESIKVCSFVGANITTGECTVKIVKTETSFTLTAKFSDGTESPHSVPYNFVYNPPSFDKTKFPVLLQIQIN